MQSIRLDTSQIIEIAKKARELGIRTGLPTSRPGVSDKAERQKWDFSIVPGKGGRNGEKKIYTLPRYIVDILEENGLLNYSSDDGGYDAAVDRPSENRANWADAKSYAEWSVAQDTAAVAPVRYYKEVFASAGSGSIPWDTEPEAMWFRLSFFAYLGIKPADCFCTRIDGDSMFPTLIDQGTALWHAVAHYTREGIYLFRQYDELRVKRLQRIDVHTYRLISDNPNKSIHPTADLDTAPPGAFQS